MAGGDLIEQRRLLLLVARDVAAQAYLRSLLADADATLARRQHLLLALDRRIKRARRQRA
jgi:hypothetical protein